MALRAALAFVVAALVLAPAAGAAAPRVIMVTGQQLDEPLFLSNHLENLDLMLAFNQGTEIEEGRTVDPKELRGRPYLQLWLFWGDTTWEPYVREHRLDELRPQQANQWGRFYPAVGERDAVMTLDVPGSRTATSKLLRIFARHGVPTRLQPAAAGRVEAPSGNGSWPWIVGGTLGALAATGAAAWRLRRRPAV